MYKLVAAVSVLALTACGVPSHRSSLDNSGNENSSDTAKDRVKKMFSSIPGHEICSGKITEETKDQTNGGMLRQIWERRAQYVNYVDRGDHFTVSYQVQVASDYLKLNEDGSWEKSDSKIFESELEFRAVWSNELGRFIGQTHWISAKANGTDRDLTTYQDHKITSITALEDKVEMRYIDVFPRQGGSESVLNSYVEELMIKQGKLSRNWSYKTLDYDRDTLNASIERDLGAEPSIDTEEKCKVVN